MRIDYLILGIAVYALLGVILNLWHTRECRPCLNYIRSGKGWTWTMFLLLCVTVGLPWAIVQAYCQWRGIGGKCE